MARRPITSLVELCEEVGVEHAQVTEVLRRVAQTVMEGNDVIVQEFGTFYRRTSKPRVRRLRGIDYQVPERVAVALKGPRFPGRELELSCEDIRDGASLESELTSGQVVPVTLTEQNPQPGVAPTRVVVTPFFSATPLCSPEANEAGNNRLVFNVVMRIDFTPVGGRPATLNVEASYAGRTEVSATSFFSTGQSTAIIELGEYTLEEIVGVASIRAELNGDASTFEFAVSLSHSEIAVDELSAFQ